MHAKLDIHSKRVELEYHQLYCIADATSLLHKRNYSRDLEGGDRQVTNIASQPVYSFFILALLRNQDLQKARMIYRPLFYICLYAQKDDNFINAVSLLYHLPGK